MLTRKIKKYLSIAVILLVVFTRVMGPVVALAEDIAPTPTPTDVQEQTVDPTLTPTDETNTTNGTDSTTLEEPTPTPTPDPTTIEATNSAELNNNVNSDANTGENVATQSAEPTPTPADETASGSDPEATTTSEDTGGSNSAIDTGDAAAVTEGENLVNTNIINSKIIHTTINLFVNENGDINLSDPFEIAKNIVVEEQSLDPTVNVLATDAQNYAFLSNDVVSIADTGANTIEGSMEATINTGNEI